jgi:hypothetical protein
MMIFGFRVPHACYFHGARRPQRRMKSNAHAGVEPANLGKDVDSQPITDAKSSTLSGKGRRQDGQSMGAFISANWVGLMTTSTGCFVSTKLYLAFSLQLPATGIRSDSTGCRSPAERYFGGWDVHLVPPDRCKPRFLCSRNRQKGHHVNVEAPRDRRVMTDRVRYRKSESRGESHVPGV